MDDNTPTWRSLDQLGHLGAVEELTKRLGDKLVNDGAGVGWCNYADACQLNAEVQAERTAASCRCRRAFGAAAPAHQSPSSSRRPAPSERRRRPLVVSANGGGRQRRRPRPRRPQDARSVRRQPQRRRRIPPPLHTERLITMQHIAIHGPRPRPDARAHQEERDDRGTPSVETRALQYAARRAVHDVDILIAAAGAAHRAASRLPGAAVSFGDYESLGDAADIMARQRTRQRW